MLLAGFCNAMTRCEASSHQRVAKFSRQQQRPFTAIILYMGVLFHLHFASRRKVKYAVLIQCLSYPAIISEKSNNSSYNSSMPVWSGDSGVDRTTTTEAASL